MSASMVRLDGRALKINGTVTLANGEIEDFGQGVHLTALAATIRATGETVRIASLSPDGPDRAPSPPAAA